MKSSSEWTVEDLEFWREDKKWACAVPRDDLATRSGLSWKKYGLIGRGKTRQAAEDDWVKWQTANKFVSDIY